MKNFDNNCIFCKIANKIISSNIIYEDDVVVAFLDNSPLTYGHSLVIPKKHYDTMLSTPKNVLTHVMNVAQRIGQIDMEILKAKGVNILINNYPSAGQVIPHFHVHVIPRYNASDGIKIENKPIEDANLPSVLEKFKKIL